ncbi:hypothetical protein BHE74_00042265 [Ensete ventricosum]|nr:hypothetical protein BHE74_00042265 [Ensete ventricosum]
MIKSLTGLVLHVVLPQTVPPRSAAPCCILVTSSLHSDSYGMNSYYNLSMCGLCQHIVEPPPPPIVFAPLAIDLRPLILESYSDEASLYDSPSPSSSRSSQTSLKLVHRCLDPGLLFPASTISVMHHFFYDNSNDSTMTYSSRVPIAAFSCPVLRPYDLNFVENKLKQTVEKLEKQLAEEQAARLEAEKISQEARMRSDEEISKLRENLESARRDAEEFRKRAESNKKCIIL